MEIQFFSDLMPQREKEGEALLSGSDCWRIDLMIVGVRGKIEVPGVERIFLVISGDFNFFVSAI